MSDDVLSVAVTKPLALIVAVFGLSTAAIGQTVAEIQVSPPNQQVGVGERFGFFATAYDANGSVVPNVTFTWSSSDVTVATVDEVGNVTAVATGVAQIIARTGEREGTAVIQVTPPRVTTPPAPPPPAYTSLQIEPRVIYLLPSERVRAQALGVLEGQTGLVPAEVTWVVTDETIISIDRNGNAVGLGSGRTTIQARTAGGVIATAPAEVQASEIELDRQGPLYVSPGDTLSIQAHVPTQDNRTIPSDLLTWRSTDANVASVDGAGRVSARQSGTTTITMSGFFQSRSLEVTVHRVVTALSATPEDSVLYVPIGGGQLLAADPLAADGTPVPNAPLTWRISDASVAQFDVETGTLTGLATGDISMTVRGPDATLTRAWQVRVVPGAVRVTPAFVRLGKGHRIEGRVEFVLEDGTSGVEARDVSWKSDAADIAMVEGERTIIGREWGLTTLRASAPWGAADSMIVRVVPELVVSSNRAEGLYRLYGTETSATEQQYVYGLDSIPMQEPAFSPNGLQIVFSSVSLEDANTDIYVMDADGHNLTRLTTHRATDQHAQWTPDGSQIVFQSGRGGEPQLFIMYADGTEVRQVTRGRAGKTEPAISRDGTMLAYVQQGRREQELYVSDIDGQQARRVAGTDTRESRPTFLPDGRLAFLEERRERGATVYQVMARDLTTSEIAPLSVSTLRIADFTVDQTGETLGLVVLEEVDGILVRRVYVQPVGNRETPTQVWEEGLASTSGLSFYPIVPRETSDR